MRQVPEPDRGEWIARLRERARLDAEELVPRPAFGVFGLAAPQLRPVALAEAGRVDGVWETIGLAYGDWAEPAGPWVTVTTAAGAADAPGRGAEAELLRAVDDERNRIADHAGVDEREPEQPPDYSHSVLAVGNGSVDGLVCGHGNLWAARLLVGELTLTVVGRGVDHGSVRLGAVRDLAPYLQGRGVMLGRLAEHHRQQPPPVLEPAEGVASYRALVEAALGSQEQLLNTLRAGRVPRHPAGEGAIWGAMWQRAVSEQARISGIGERQADKIVTLVVNHLTHLQEEALWFTVEPRLREAAIDETLRHAVLGEDVPSKPAQRAWARYWTHHMSVAGQEPAAAIRAHPEAGTPLTSGWLEAWSAWAARG
jgi:hypothetical protein